MDNRAHPPPQYSLKLKYVGPALASGRMSARDAGEAILAAGKLLERVSDLSLPGKRQQITLEVDSRFKRGSFEIAFHLVSWAGENLAAVSIDDLERIAKLVFGSGGLIAIYKVMRSRPTTVERDGGSIIINAGGDRAQVTANVYNLLVDPATAQDLRDLMQPLRRPGIDSLEAKSGRKKLASVREEEASYFAEPLQPQHEIITQRGEATLEVLQVDFQRGHKWQFRKMGDAPFYALIEDERFWENVGDGESFRAGDVLVVELETVTTIHPHGTPDVTRRVLRVRAHRAQEDQLEHGG